MISQAAFNKENPEFDSSSASTSDHTQDLIHVTFNQNSTQDKVLVTNISSIHVCVCVEFLMKVADLFTKAMPPTQPKTIEAATLAQTEHDRRAVKTESKRSQVPSSEPEKGSLDFTLKLGKPEIFLIEDQMNPHTDSLIVDVEVDFRMRMNPSALSINGSIRQLSLVSCVFGKADTKKAFQKGKKRVRIISRSEKHLLEIAFCCYRRKWDKLPTMFYVLSPVDISVIGNGPVGKDQHIDVSMTDFIMTVSPAT
ncbi:hypothetical protein EGW08_008814, partial [Elysia chlorotica]